MADQDAIGGQQYVNLDGYCPAQDDGFEPFSSYIDRGFAPLHIGDTLNNGVYTILYKLGSGDSSNVWLARDNSFISTSSSLHPYKYVALRILSSGLPADSPVFSIMLQLHHVAVIELITTFTHASPNGSHKVLVMRVVRPLIQLSQAIEDLGDIKIAFSQLLSGVAYLHQHGVVHGNLHNLNTASICAPIIDATLEGLPAPDMYPVPHWAYEKAQGRLPRYTVSDRGWTDPDIVDEHIRSPPHVYMLGFSSAFRFPSTNMRLPTIRIPQEYMPPEYLFKQTSSRESSLSPSKQDEYDLKNCEKVDIWALGCIFYEFLTGTSLLSDEFYGHWSKAQRALHVDPRLPSDWLLPSSICEADQYHLHKRGEDFWTDTESEIRCMFEVESTAGGTHDGEPFDGYIRLLRYMLVLDPRSRPSAEEALRFLDQVID